MKITDLKKHGLGFTQIFWGNGKGKSTSSFGTALRACGNGYRVHMVQFMKNGADSLEEQIPGEIKALEEFDNFSYKRFGTDGWIIKKPTENQIKATQDALTYVKQSLQNPNYDIIIADEILYAIQLGLLSEDEIISLIENKPEGKELILTGSHVPYPRIFEKAELVTEIKKIKHPYDSGFIARKGIEY
ncbi:cob(I)yrinic acid a,c-diamide adenosyltransferase [Candidatus Pacearchaeota archaeon CG10_big_fil_rev_8_21_14_0_10_34_76]|nr:MAG: cob(I)yrinic acid a,c-diamide adenosyltransferase [Candidatus Pacearchaeota archaeon CG10_big_fil_rev_8_21_14_0_10_34_76]